MEITNHELCRLIALRPAFYKGTTVIYKLELDDLNLYNTQIEIVDALNLTRGDTCTVRARGVWEEHTDKYELFNVYIEADVLTKFISAFGTDNICCTFIAELECRYGTYSSVDHFINDSEAYGYKLNKIIKVEN